MDRQTDSPMEGSKNERTNERKLRPTPHHSLIIMNEDEWGEAFVRPCYTVSDTPFRDSALRAEDDSSDPPPPDSPDFDDDVIKVTVVRDKSGLLHNSARKTSEARAYTLRCCMLENSVAVDGKVNRVQVDPLVVVEGALRDDMSTKELDGCSHYAALVEHKSGQEKVADSSSTTSNKWLAFSPELVQLLAHPLYNDQSSHDAEVKVANYLATYGAVHEESSQTQ
ncbi:hypothetical protein HPB51_021981 [Rhipicephalus microplus]|uniref:Uncharacterized protein n=1 Tax=Rhipicephalus microplus TaxID=6941 RepID=A0A9J6DWD5_RHIMP|nr:hypothetical protein HPB51_021981 [Rhipicephalus microplus]